MPGFAIGLYKVSISIGVGALLGSCSIITETGHWLVLAACAVCAHKYKSFLGCIVLICSWALTINLLAHKLPQTVIAEGVYTLEGVVVGLPSQGARATGFDLKTDPEFFRFGKQVRLKWYGGPVINPGQRWRLAVKLKTPRNYANPGSFDYRMYLQRQGIELTGYVKRGQLLSDRGGGVDRWRYKLRSHLQELLPLNQAAWVSALLLGDRSQLSNDQWQMLAATGTTHLMIVSGMHIGLMAGVGTLIGRCLFFFFALFGVGQRPWFIVVTGFGLASVYALVTGFGVPAQRALIMLLLAMFAWVAGLRADLRTLLPLVFTAVLWIDPLVLNSPGLWLSFTAVAALLASFAYQVGNDGRMMMLLRAQLAILVALSPVLLFFGYPIALLAPGINLLAIPVMGCLLLPGLLLTLLTEFFIADPAVWTLWGPVLSLLEHGLGLLAALDWVVEPTGQSWWALLSGMIAALFLLWPGCPFGVAATVLWLTIFWPRHPSLAEGAVRISMLDVGQGLSVLVETRDHALLFDTGDRFEHFILGRAVVEPYLRQRGIDQLDLIVLSHSDRDHVGGSDYLARRFDADTVLTGWSENSCHSAPAWDWNRVSFRFLPEDQGLTADNERSCVLLIEAGGRKAMLTGDIGRAREQQLVNVRAQWQPLDLLQVAHHGSRSSSSEEFLQASTPIQAWISAGFRNRYGHPHPEVLKRLEQYSKKIRLTAQHGALELVIEPQGGLKWRSYLAE